MQPNYQGDYDYHSSFGNTAIGGWTDGRNIISGNAQQDVFVNLVKAHRLRQAQRQQPRLQLALRQLTRLPLRHASASTRITQIAGSMVPGTTDIGNHCDDCVTTIALPFPYTLYDQSFTMVNLSSNGNAQLTTTDPDFSNICVPWTAHNYAILPHWDDLYTLNAGFGSSPRLVAPLPTASLISSGVPSTSQAPALPTLS